MRRADAIQNANTLYDGLMIELASGMPIGEAGETFLGVDRAVRGMPVTTEGRRPVIGVDDMDAFTLPYERESARLTATAVDGPYKVGQSAIRIAFSTSDSTAPPYGPPISLGLDFGVPLGEEGEPVYTAFGVVVKRGEVPNRIEAKRADGDWEEFQVYKPPSRFRRTAPLPKRGATPEMFKGYEALFMGGVLYRAMTFRFSDIRPMFETDPDDG